MLILNQILIHVFVVPLTLMQADSLSLLDVPGALLEVMDEVGLEPTVPRTRSKSFAWAVVDTMSEQM